MRTNMRYQLQELVMVYKLLSTQLELLFGARNSELLKRGASFPDPRSRVLSQSKVEVGSKTYSCQYQQHPECEKDSTVLKDWSVEHSPIFSVTAILNM